MSREYVGTVGKAGWGDGPWQNEPDKLQWVDDATGLDCLLVRHPRFGHLCGYVGVPPGHPCHGSDYRDVEADVHGGLTFSDRCDDGPPLEEGVCHAPFPGWSADVWWFGFDCGHFMDYMPGLAAEVRQLGFLDEVPMRDEGSFVTYRTVAYVQAECAHLARQLADR